MIYLKKIEKFKDFIFIKAPSELDDWEQMILMSLCQHHIIANSTFSWWGAYLRESVDGMVYYPSKWFGPKGPVYKICDIIPETKNYKVVFVNNR